MISLQLSLGAFKLFIVLSTAAGIKMSQGRSINESGSTTVYSWALGNPFKVPFAL
jgi:hypothetical protein